jgi:hypothetical protein
MKASILFFAGLFIFTHCVAQQPVEWSFHAKKTSENKYEIHLSATIDKGWRIVSQFSSKNERLAPAEIKIEQATGLKLSKKVEELGSVLQKKDATTNISVTYFEHNADFVVTASSGKTVTENLRGTITYVAFNDTEILPKFTVTFSVPVK